MQQLFLVNHAFLGVKIREICYCDSLPFVFLRQLLVTSRELNPSSPCGADFPLFSSLPYGRYGLVKTTCSLLNFRYAQFSSLDFDCGSSERVFRAVGRREEV